MNTSTPTIETETPKTPHISFIAYPLGAWLLAILCAGGFAFTSTHPERMNIMQIMIAASLATATVGGTLYVLSLLALKRYPSFKQSFLFGFVNALVCIVAAIILDQPKLSFMMIGVFLLVSAIFPFVVKRRVFS